MEERRQALPVNELLSRRLIEYWNEIDINNKPLNKRAKKNPIYDAKKIHMYSKPQSNADIGTDHQQNDDLAQGKSDKKI